MSKPIGVVIAGTGFGAKVHIPGLQHYPETQILGIYHRHLPKAQAFAAEYAIPHSSDRLEALLSLPGVEALSIATPPFLHYEMGKLALEAGKHLLLEKPLNLNAQETKHLYYLAQHQGLVVTPDFEFRFIPAWQYTKELLEQDFVGKKRLIKVDWLVPSRANPERPWNWYSRQDMGGGILGAVGSHTFDYLSWLFGPISRLCAFLRCAIPERQDPLDGNRLKPVDAEDTALILLELSDRTPVQLSLSSVTYNGRGHWLEIYGEKGTLVLGSDNLKDYVHGFRVLAASAGNSLSELEIPKRLAFPQVFSDGRLAPFIRVVDHWVENIRTDHSTSPNLKDGVYSQLLMDLCQRSHQQGSWVTVPPIDDFLSS
jgi:predicted dehydrogenase